LPEENLDYKYLLKEYHDGILLFNLTNDLIWKKAQSDTAGLETYYKTAKKYNWNPRIETLIYEYTDSTLTQKLPATAKKHAKTSPGKEYNLSGLCLNDSVKCVNIKEKTYEKGLDSFADKLTWKKGAYLSLPDKGKYYFYYVKNVLPESTKKLSEARGLYIADYQNYLESNWVKHLREKYKVTINEPVFTELKAELTK
jgi:peptidyl-prolyl cis-trans isomerase SurA